MHLAELEIKTRPSAPIEESDKLCPRSPASTSTCSDSGQDCDVAQECSPSAWSRSSSSEVAHQVDQPKHAVPKLAQISLLSTGPFQEPLIVEPPDMPAKLVESGEECELDVPLIKLLNMPAGVIGDQQTCVHGAYVIVDESSTARSNQRVVDELLKRVVGCALVDESLTARSHATVDESLTARSYRGLVDDLLTARSHQGTIDDLLTARSQRGMVDESLTARSHRGMVEGLLTARSNRGMFDELFTEHSRRDESLSARSHRGRLCSLLVPAFSASDFAAVDRTALVDELLTARSDHVALELSFLMTLAHSAVPEVASPGRVTPRGAEPSQGDIDVLGQMDPTEMLQNGSGVSSSTDCNAADAQALSTDPGICEGAPSIPKPVQVPVRAAPGAGLQERLQALAAAGLRSHVVAATPCQDSSNGVTTSLTTPSLHESAACRKGSVGDDGSEAGEEGGEAGDGKSPPKSQLRRYVTGAESLTDLGRSVSGSGALPTQPSASASPPSVRPGFACPVATKISAEQLRAAGAEVMVDPQVKEMYLSDEEFQRIFGMSHREFTKMAKWKQHALKKEHGLF